MQLATVGSHRTKDAGGVSPAPLSHESPRSFPGFILWAGLGALLAAEVIGLSVAFDAGTRAEDPGWAGKLVFRSPRLLHGAVVTAVVAIALTSWFLGREVRAAARDVQSRRVIAGCLVAHFVAFGWLIGATDCVLGDWTRGAAISVWDVLAWVFSAALSVGFLAAAAVRPRVVRQLLWKARGILLAAVLIGAAVELVTRALQSQWESLGTPTLWVSHQVLRLFASDTVCDADSYVLGTQGFRVTVTPACSGYEGMALIAAYVGGYIWFFRRELRLPHALILMPVGLAIIWLVNVVRIAALVLIGDRVSPGLALGGFHSQAGWLAFNAVALLLVGVTHRTGLFAREPTHSAPTGDNATAAYLAPIAFGLAMQLVATAFIENSEVAYLLRSATAGLLLCLFWSRYESLKGPFLQTRGTAFAIAAGVFVTLLWVVLADNWSVQDVVPPGGGSVDMSPGLLAAWVVARVVGFVVITPIVEELAFRGYLMRRLIAADFQTVSVGRFTWTSFLVSSVLFGVLHGEWLAGTVAGIIYAAVVYRTGRLWDAVIAHATTNALLIGIPALSILVGK